MVRTREKERKEKSRDNMGRGREIGRRGEMNRDGGEEGR